jgi:hypothetical protein
LGGALVPLVVRANLIPEDYDQTGIRERESSSERERDVYENPSKSELAVNTERRRVLAL